ncbi:Uncharacterised protein [uncultured archaeon]|nr:Uncharacterised protein [uncultured archaeon]
MKKSLLLAVVLFVGLFQSVLAYDPYYIYIQKRNPRLKPGQIAEIIAANREFSKKYHQSMFWHMAKTGHESGYKPEIGTEFTIAGRRYNNEPCYGIECLQADVVAGMYPKIPLSVIKWRLLHDFRFSIEAAYRLDMANQIKATKWGFKSEYQNRVVTLITYNCGPGSWQKYHVGISKYLKSGKKLEDITLAECSKLGMSFREFYSLNYYSNIITQARILNYYLSIYPPTQVGTGHVQGR